MDSSTSGHFRVFVQAACLTLPWSSSSLVNGASGSIGAAPIVLLDASACPGRAGTGPEPEPLLDGSSPLHRVSKQLNRFRVRVNLPILGRLRSELRGQDERVVTYNSSRLQVGATALDHTPPKRQPLKVTLAPGFRDFDTVRESWRARM